MRQHSNVHVCGEHGGTMKAFWIHLMLGSTYKDMDHHLVGLSLLDPTECLSEGIQHRKPDAAMEIVLGQELKRPGRNVVAARAGSQQTVTSQTPPMHRHVHKPRHTSHEIATHESSRPHRQQTPTSTPKQVPQGTKITRQETTSSYPKAKQTRKGASACFHQQWPEMI